MKKLFGLILIFVMVFSINIIARADDVEPLTITLTPDKSIMNAGETITVEYSVTGGSGSYKSISYAWDTYSGGTWINGRDNYVSNTEGTASFIPEKGIKVRFWFSVEDSEGRTVSQLSKEIPIQGFDDVEPLTITLTPDKSIMNAGETITVEYSVTGGSGSYKSISYAWDTYSGGTWVNGRDNYVSNTEGTASFIPEKGIKVRFWFSVEDSEGRTASQLSKDIPIQGFDDVEPLTITLTPDKSIMNAGETITVEYSVTGGSGSYKSISYAWDIYSGGVWVNGSDNYVSNPEGTASFIPEKGIKVRFWFTVKDSEGRTASQLSKEIPINPLAIVLAPYPSVVYSGETVMIEPSINNGAEDTFTFLSSDTSVLTVDNSGLVIGVSPGQASVLITAEGLNLTKTIGFSIVPSDSPEITATLGNPVRTTRYGASGGIEELSFTAEVSGGFTPYTYHFYLYRDGIMVAEAETDTGVFKTSGDVITANGTYTAKVVVRDTAWRTTVAWSSGFYRQASGSSTVGTFGMAQPDFTIPQGTRTVGDEAFEGTKASVVRIPDGCEQIGTRAFANSSVSQIYMPPSCNISDDAFAGCGFLNIFGTKGSEAERFAIRNHERCRFIEVN